MARDTIAFLSKFMQAQLLISKIIFWIVKYLPLDKATSSAVPQRIDLYRLNPYNIHTTQTLKHTNINSFADDSHTITVAQDLQTIANHVETGYKNYND